MSRFVTIACLAVFALPAYADTLMSGRYAITASASYGPAAGQRTHESEQCIDSAQFHSDPNALMRSPGSQNQDCETEQYEVADGNFAMKMACTMAEGSAAMAGVGTYTSTGFDVVNTMTINANGATMVVKTQMQGRRIGDC